MAVGARGRQRTREVAPRCDAMDEGVSGQQERWRVYEIRC